MLSATPLVTRLRAVEQNMIPQSPADHTLISLMLESQSKAVDEPPQVI